MRSSLLNSARRFVAAALLRDAPMVTVDQLAAVSKRVEELSDRIAALAGADQLAAVSQRVEELFDRTAAFAGVDPLAAISQRIEELAGRMAALVDVDQLIALSQRADKLSRRVEALAVIQAGNAPQQAPPEGQDKDLPTLRSIIQRLEAEATERYLSIEANQRAVEERLRRLEPSTILGEPLADAAAVRDNLLDIRLGQLESRILTTLEGPYFERLAEMIRSGTASEAELSQRSGVSPESGRTEP